MGKRDRGKTIITLGVISLLTGGLLFVCAGCNQRAPTPPPPTRVEQEAPPPAEPQNEEAVAEVSPTPVYEYDPAGRREPFEPLIAVDIPEVEDVIVTPPPEELTSPLQKFDLKQIKVVGIILGGLGDYARVLAPDGQSYTINVGTLMGKNKGKVLTIQENLILVKETIQYESGKVEEVETPLYLDPEEGRKP